jgi:kynurenine formamidase
VPKEPLAPITLSDLRPYGDKVRDGDAFLVGTGWDKEWNSPRYLAESPHFTLDAVLWLRDLGVTLLGGDIPYFNDPRGSEVNVITEFYQRPANMIVAPLVNVTRLSRSRVRLLTLPLKLKGQSVAPCRVLALEY